uniref:LRAT domain-containing protein n=1 Tax=Daphnia galeata TaxID=27404 RepID=A0A8J2RTY4_9CRUS|nr:unnamed protein product [Daphnia galeata]
MYFIMNPFNAPDEIRATKGDLIEFQRQFLKMIPYFHFAVYTVDSEADAGLINVQLNRSVGHGLTVGVALLPFSICYFLRKCSIRYKIVKKTIRDLCDNERGCRVNNLEEAATEKGLEPLDPDVIVERAREFLRRNLIENYNLFTKNCEHFATMCRYEEGFSQQASQNFYPMERIIQEVRWNEEEN